MSAAYGIIPFLGGATLLMGGTAALWLDRRQMLNDPSEPRPIVVRYTSQATYDLQTAPHWIFVVTTAVYGPCLIMTALWQATLARELQDMDDDNNLLTKENLPTLLVWQATATAWAGFGVALLPMGTVFGTIVHTVNAIIFASIGLQYCFQAYALASDRDDDDGLATIRLALGSFGGVGGLVTCFSVVPGVSGTAALHVHKKRLLLAAAARDANDNADNNNNNNNNNNTTDNNNNTEDSNGLLTPRQCWLARLGETALAVGQISLALTMGFCLLTATVEVGDVQDGDPVVWLVGVANFIVMVALALVFYRTNQRWVLWCQTFPEDKKDENENGPDDNNHAEEVVMVDENAEESADAPGKPPTVDRGETKISDSSD